MKTETATTQAATTSGTFLLFLLFLALKLTGVIDWSWWWVTAPLWAPAVIAGMAIAVVAVVVGIRKHARRRRVMK